jgi:hypothetical protein
MLEVVASNGWAQMRWDRVPALVSIWAVKTLDTTALTPAGVAAEVKSWICGVLSGSEPALDLRVI